MITFVIPTWNRSDKLEKCVESIACQTPHKIIISDNASTDDTRQVAERLKLKYPFIEYRCRDSVGDYQDSFRTAFLASESEWTWTFGDDDVLLPGALGMAERMVVDSATDFIHVSEKKRVGRACMITGTLLDLCSRYGWIDITGFISGNIIRTSKLKEAANSTSWEIYGKSAFVHSCSLLEVMAKSKAVLFEYPMVETQSDDASEDTLKRWKEAKITYRYLLIADALMDMRKRGVIPEKVNEDFFRYMETSIFFRLMHDLVVRSLEGADPPLDEDLERFIQLTDMVDGHRGDEMTSWSRDCMNMIRGNTEVVRRMREAQGSLVARASSLALPSYGVQYIYDQEV